MKIAIAQNTATSDLNHNLTTLERFMLKAKEAGAELLVLPEMAYFQGKRRESEQVCQQYAEQVQRFRSLAKQYQLALIPGTLREPTDHPQRWYNTLLFIDAEGNLLSQYRKLFLYQASLPDRNYDETQYSVPGKEIVTLAWRGVTLGFAICFDLRFPELFRSLKKRGAQVIFLPSAFTIPTGEAHWEILVRARAIENQCFVVAPGLVGITGEGAGKYGHSLVVSPWGEVKLDLGEGEAIHCVDLDMGEIVEAQKRVPAWNCRREDLFTVV